MKLRKIKWRVGMMGRGDMEAVSSSLDLIIDIQTAQYSCRDEVLLFSVPMTIISDFKHSKSCSSHLLDPCFLPPLTLPDLH